MTAQPIRPHYVRIKPAVQKKILQRAIENPPLQYQPPPKPSSKPRHQPEQYLDDMHQATRQRKEQELQAQAVQQAAQIEQIRSAPAKNYGSLEGDLKQAGQKLDIPTLISLASLRVGAGTDRSSSTFVKRVQASLPQLHAKQMEIKLSTAKRKVVGTGRRVGKTVFGCEEGIDAALHGKRVLFASPSQDQVDAFWEYCKKWLASFIEAGEILKNENRRILEFPSTGGRIKAKTASDADMLRGDFADFMVLDECAMLEENAWNEVGAPMLLDNDGDCLFLSSPKRRNWFYNLYTRALSDDTGRWAAFHATSFDNPYLSEEALEEIMSDMSSDTYQQEILGIFLEGDGAVFRNIMRSLTAPIDPSPQAHASHFKVMGVDWGQVRDYTVFSVFCATCMQELDIERFNRVEWALARERLITKQNKWGVRHILAESNAIGKPNIETLQNDDHMPIVGFDTNSQSKPRLIRALSLCFERCEATWLPDQTAKLELEAFEAVTSRVTGHTAYSAPKGGHDDTVIARGLALQAAIEGPPLQAPSALSFSELGSVAQYEDSAYDTPITGINPSQGNNAAYYYSPNVSYAIGYQQPPANPYGLRYREGAEGADEG